MAKAEAQAPEPQRVPFGPTLGMLMDAIEADYNRQVEQAIRAAANERGYELGPGKVQAELARREWVVPKAGEGS